MWLPGAAIAQLVLLLPCHLERAHSAAFYCPAWDLSQSLLNDQSSCSPCSDAISFRGHMG